MDLTEKLAELERKRMETVAKLKERLKYFHGIKHENADSEYKYNQIKVLEAHVLSLTEEIEELKAKIRYSQGPLA
ncbi:MAG: hypothetical protein UW73_C0009G0010 [Microgenomates group bacterium GW2011_GWB1_44_8]|nr:MAG: hypothetical protein UW73_C0009G0010 [Microgenomates group bacterium GW2011_GWB1_44_8]